MTVSQSKELCGGPWRSRSFRVEDPRRMADMATSRPSFLLRENPGTRKDPRDNLADANHLSFSINGQLFLSCALNLVSKLCRSCSGSTRNHPRLNLGSANSPERPEQPESMISRLVTCLTSSANRTFGPTQRFYHVILGQV
jgi:hypothetical protein